MEWNWLLLWISGFSSLVTFVRLAKAPVKPWGWMAACVIVLVAGGAAYVAAPDIAGYVAGAMWALLLLLPSMLIKRVLRAAAHHDFARAKRWTSVARWFHPADGWWYQPRMFAAYDAVQRGDRDEAARLFESLRNVSGYMGFSAELQLLGLRHDWPGVIALAGRQENLLEAPNALPTLLRALGESGQPDAMIVQYLRYSAALHFEGLAGANAMARWMLLAYTGRGEAMERLTAQHFPRLPAAHRALWRARADWIAGRSDTAVATLQRLTADPAVGTEAQYTLDHPPAPLQLSPASRVLVAQVELDVDHEARYAVPIHGVRGRPLVTWGLLTANCIMFAIELLLGGEGGQNPEVLLRLGAASSYEPFVHQWWRVIAANFLHYGYAHLLMNMLALRALGPFIEMYLGRWRYAVLYLVSGIGAIGGVISLPMLGIGEGADFLVGASGAIMGLIGANAAILAKGWLRDKAAVAGRRLRLVLFIVALQVVFDQLTPQVSGTAHLLGLGIGFVMTLVLMIRLRR